jgi:hypothetical protein
VENTRPYDVSARYFLNTIAIAFLVEERETGEEGRI